MFYFFCACLQLIRSLLIRKLKQGVLLLFLIVTPSCLCATDIICSFNPTMASAPLTIQNFSFLQINTTLIPLETPLLYRHGTLYAPLDDVATGMYAEYVYLRKQDGYQLTFRRQRASIVIFPNSTDCFLKGEKITFSTASLYEKGRLYVPLFEMFKAINRVSEEPFIIYLSMIPEKTHVLKNSLEESSASKQPAAELGYIHGISERKTQGGLSLQLTKSGSFSKPIMTVEPQRLILEFLNVTTSIRETILSETGLFSFIKCHLDEKKSSTQLTIYFNQKVPSFSIQETPETFTLLLPFRTNEKRPLSKEEHVERIVIPPKKKPILYQKTILIDAGHGGKDPGSQTSNGDYEKVFTLDVALRLKQLLKEEGAIVVMTRETDMDQDLPKRIECLEKSKADVLISVHFNSLSQTGRSGTETYYYKKEDKVLALVIHQCLIQELGLKNLGVKRSRLYLLTHSVSPSVLVEPAFLSHEDDLEKIKNPLFRQKIAIAISKGLTLYFNSRL